MSLYVSQFRLDQGESMQGKVRITVRNGVKGLWQTDLELWWERREEKGKYTCGS